LIYPVGGLLTSLGAATDGQLPIGDTDSTPVLATLTGTSGLLSVSNGAGSITLNISDLTDPGGDRLMFWDETDNKLKWITFSTTGGLAIGGTEMYWDILNIAQLSTTPDDNSIMVFDGPSGGMLWEFGNTFNTTIGLGTGDSPTFAGLNISTVDALPDPAVNGKIIRLSTDDHLYLGIG